MRIISRKRLYDILSYGALLAAVCALVTYPRESVAAAGDGLTLCANVIIPSLFPFFVLSSMVVSTGLADGLGTLLSPIMRPLFNVGGVCSSALALGFVGGYPVGARTVAALYKNGSCTKPEAERLLAFCNNSGPAFILGVVGAGVFASSKIGLMLYLAHASASLITGVIFRGWGEKNSGVHVRRNAGAERLRFIPAFTDAVKTSFTASLNICGFVIFFTVIIRLLIATGVIPMLAEALAAVFGPLGLDAKWAERLITGALELSSGVWSLKDAAGVTASVAMAAFMLGWAGLSVHCQTLSFIGESDLSVTPYILGKLLHGVISAVIVYFMSRIFAFDLAAASYLAEQVDELAAVNFFSALTASLTAAGGLAALLLAAYRYKRFREREKKRRR